MHADIWVVVKIKLHINNLLGNYLNIMFAKNTEIIHISDSNRLFKKKYDFSVSFLEIIYHIILCITLSTELDQITFLVLISSVLCTWAANKGCFPRLSLCADGAHLTNNLSIKNIQAPPRVARIDKQDSLCSSPRRKQPA